MASTYNIPTSSLGKVQRWMAAQKAAGRKVQPWEVEAIYKSELGNLAGQQTTNRQITLNESQAAEAARMNEVNTTLSRERMAADATAQEKSLAQQALLAEKQMAFNKAQARLAEERAARMEARQKEIDDYEQKANKDRTDEDKRRYEQNRIDQEADRNAAKNMQLTSSLTGVGTMAGLSLLMGKDASGATGGGRLIDSIFGSKKPTVTTSAFPSEYDYGQTMTDQDMAGLQGGNNLSGVPNPADDWSMPAPDDYGASANYDYGMGGGDFGYNDYGGADGFGTYDYGMGAGDYGALDYSSLMGSGLDWGSDWASEVDWGAIDWSGLF